MYLSEGYVSLELARHAEQQLLIELERRRVINERQAEAAAHAAEGMTDAPSPRRGIRALLPRRLRPLQPPPRYALS
ncbi:hypothetical protein J7E25_08500 [Agromyces sp. ISL-38]|uniref:hypothetical protein n=1 Tax=Agromyces sp. ISL-38 TaxID=2819107 RepID=UPI001BE7DA37|nr:hypothetical protein [Agromyces sp. ISL-38]MBT2499134.1 hypothetical protein [Agromyces sp. ISL-38]MBT2518323.1 hypothetical protein [Streptomyces sp. ISL-90]